MKTRISIFIFALAGWINSQAAEKPNIVLIMVDDMGWSNIGPYGGMVETPTLDRLARNGVRFDQFYNACLLYTSPSPRDATLSRMPSSA